MPADDPSAIKSALGRAIRSLREERGLTQEALAESAGLHPRYISDVERGRRSVGIANLDRLARALSVDLPALSSRVESERGGGPASGGP